MSITVVYDSRIHGSYHYIRDLTNEQHGEARQIGEEEWIKAYVSVRRNWLATNQNSLLRKTVYRMDAFRALIDGNKWELPLPLTVRNVVISEALFSADYVQPTIVPDSDKTRTGALSDKARDERGRRQEAPGGPRFFRV